MSDFRPGQVVRLWSVEEICERYGCTKADLEFGYVTDGAEFPGYAIECCDEEYQISEVDDSDHTVFLNGADIWVSQSIIEFVEDSELEFDFKPGDRVVFREYEDMKNDGSLYYNWFIPNMKYLCGHEATVVSVEYYDHHVAKVSLTDCTADLADYQFSTGMLEHAPENVPEVNEDSFLSMIGR